jgi:hypothetical protein
MAKSLPCFGERRSGPETGTRWLGGMILFPGFPSVRVWRDSALFVSQLAGVGVLWRWRHFETRRAFFMEILRFLCGKT